MRLRVYLILMAIAILIPVIAFSALALRMLQNAERAAALRGLHETANGIALLVERELYSAEAALRVLASSNHLSNGNMAAFYEQARIINKGPDGWVVLLDENGQQIINTIIPFGTRLPPPAAGTHVEQVLVKNGTFVSGVITGSASQRLATTLSIPVVLKNGRQYVLAKTFSTEHFNRLISSARVPPQWLVAIIDGQGRFIARSQNKEELVGKQASPELVAAMHQHENGQIRHKTLEGTDVYDAFTQSSLSGWNIAIAAPVALIEYSARRAALVAALGMLAAIICAAGAALLFGGRLVQSIKRAAHAAVELGQGKLPQHATSHVVEVNELHAALREAALLVADSGTSANRRNRTAGAACQRTAGAPGCGGTEQGKGSVSGHARA
jgi:hypothetical protein